MELSVERMEERPATEAGVDAGQINGVTHIIAEPHIDWSLAWPVTAGVLAHYAGWAFWRRRTDWPLELTTVNTRRTILNNVLPDVVSYTQRLLYSRVT